MRGDIFLSLKEARRLHVIEQTIAGKLTIAQAAQLLNLSERQVKRLKKGVMVQGEAFLVHKNRGCTPKNAIPREVRDMVVSCALGKYKNASGEQMAELLAEDHGIEVSARSVRRILSAAGIPLKYARKPARRRRSRDRMPSFGMLMQCDASPFAWFEERGPQAVLHGVIDDATSKVLALYFRPTEDLFGYFTVLLHLLLNFGIPKAFYCDRHTIFFSPKKDKLSIEEELAGKTVKLTQFGRALSELGIEHIPARSPQAKGRVERLWGTLQGRLTIELRRAGISDIDAANRFLPGFIAKFNARFEKEPASQESAFGPRPAKETLDRIVCLKETRKASNGSTIPFGGKTYQLLGPSGAVLPLKPRSAVEVLTLLDGTLAALYEEKYCRLKEFQPSANKASKLRTNAPHIVKKTYSPPATHPWRRPIKTCKRSSDPAPYDGFWEDVYAG